MAATVYPARYHFGFADIATVCPPGFSFLQSTGDFLQAVETETGKRFIATFDLPDERSRLTGLVRYRLPTPAEVREHPILPPHRFIMDTKESITLT